MRGQDTAIEEESYSLKPNGEEKNTICIQTVKIVRFLRGARVGEAGNKVRMGVIPRKREL